MVVSHHESPTTSQLGASMVEFALTITLVLGLVLGMAQFFIIYFQRGVIYDAFTSFIRNTGREDGVWSTVAALDVADTANYSPVASLAVIQSGITEFKSLPQLAPHFNLSSQPLFASTCCDLNLRRARVRYTLNFELSCPLCSVASFGFKSRVLPFTITESGIIELPSAADSCANNLPTARDFPDC